MARYSTTAKDARKELVKKAQAWLNIYDEKNLRAMTPNSQRDLRAMGRLNQAVTAGETTANQMLAALCRDGVGRAAFVDGLKVALGSDHWRTYADHGGRDEFLGYEGRQSVELPGDVILVVNWKRDDPQYGSIVVENAYVSM